MLIPMLHIDWMCFGWWTILDIHMELLSVNCWALKTAALQFLAHSNWCAWHLLSYPLQRHFNLLSRPSILNLAQSPPSQTIHVFIVSRLENHFLTRLLPFIYTDRSGFKVTSIRDHSFHLDSPGQSMSWKRFALSVYDREYTYLNRHTGYRMPWNTEWVIAGSGNNLLYRSHLLTHAISPFVQYTSNKQYHADVLLCTRST